MRFPFRFAPSYRWAALPFGVTPATAFVEVSEGRLLVRFGLWRLETSVTNVAGHEGTGGFAFVKTAGPPHLSLADRGVTFATNADRALCVRFQEPVKTLLPTGRLRHPSATLTVADPPGLAAMLDAER
ncbi:MAG: hypothetical protein AVDCRST_MAG34-2036 [uncultured Nocardioidaceae bacterium]|uniref:Uncharacterized protein n=1 Tax=uncultured Nocardioidaceae bacterium TaxID=253824 RepID=A0A6J4MCA0_9ACTN|nr:MAG: hypothetical protein AVDCRST_MAG34-2036 [uncultured Nocardioidaceae bacterium]